MPRLDVSGILAEKRIQKKPSGNNFAGDTIEGIVAHSITIQNFKYSFIIEQMQAKHDAKSPPYFSAIGMNPREKSGGTEFNYEEDFKQAVSPNGVYYKIANQFFTQLNNSSIPRYFEI